MSSSPDRVAVPTNGHRPPLKDDALDPPHHDAWPADHQPAEAGARPDAAASLTPGQLLAGVGVLAALAVLLIGRRRGRG